MPPRRATKRKAPSRREKESTDSEEEPKTKRVFQSPKPKVSAKLVPCKRASKRKKPAPRGGKEATDNEEEPGARPVPKPKPQRSRAYKMPPPLPAGEVLTDAVKHRWRLGVSVGKGGFGEIYRAVPVGSAQDVHHVIKIEPKENGPLYTEIAFYCRAAKGEMIDSWVSSHKLAYLPIPKYIAQGQHSHAGLSYRFLVMNCFGEDVEKKFNQCGRSFSIKTLCHLALRILEALQYLHTSEYAHGDIKGSNLLTGLHPAQQHRVYLVDYGLACRFRPEGRHREYKEDPRRQHDGTLEFTSIDAHKGVTPSARGDLEILAYCLLQWSSGCLPWDQYVKQVDKDSVARLKIRYKSDVSGLMKTCFSSSTPPSCLRHYLTYVHGLDYQSMPDYDKVRQMFVKELASHRLRDDGKNLDWTRPTKSKVVAEVVEHYEQTDDPSPRKKVAAVSSQGRQRVKAKKATEPHDDPLPKAAPAKTRGKKRKLQTVTVADPISDGCSSAASGAGHGTDIMPQVSYPTALGYGPDGVLSSTEEPTKKKPKNTRRPPKPESREFPVKSKTTSPTQRRKPKKN